MEQDRLSQQIAFILEIDKLKAVYRQTLITAENRRENDAEHSWHLAVMAILLQEYANAQKIDLLRVVEMALVHDLVEIDAGDTFAYDEVGYKDKEEREMKAAKRLFSLLPVDQKEHVFALWREYEEGQTAESRFATALDRLHPMLLNYHTGGAAWQKHQVRQAQVIKRNRVIAEGSQPLWDYAAEVIRKAVEEGILLS